MFVFTLTIRVRGIDRNFGLLGDQIRDWSIALRPLNELPLVGPPTHFGGYTIGPAFYWILWVIRVTVGPWFDNLPHAGGIGQAILQSGVDSILLVAVWKRTQSLWIALTTIVLLATAAYDLSLAAVIWNPVVGSTLAKLAIALVLLDWPRRSTVAVAVTAAAAWSAVHAYTGAIFVALGVFVALLIDPFSRSDRKTDRAETLYHRYRSLRHWWHSPLGLSARNGLVIAIVVVLLQLPYAAHQASIRFSDSAMGVVTGSLGQILSGNEPPQFARSLASYVRAFNGIQVAPFQAPWAIWLLMAGVVIFAIRYRHDRTLVTVTLLPQVAALLGYAFFLGDLDNYYYLSLMPGVVLAMVLSATALPRGPQRGRERVGSERGSRVGVGWRPLARIVSVALFVGSLALVPARIRYAAPLHKMPEYGALVDGSRKMAGRAQPMRAIETEFNLPFTGDADYVYQVLGGRIDSESSWIGVIKSDGSVSYQKVSGPREPANQSDVGLPKP